MHSIAEFVTHFWNRYTPGHGFTRSIVENLLRNSLHRAETVLSRIFAVAAHAPRRSEDIEYVCKEFQFVFHEMGRM